MKCHFSTNRLPMEFQLTTNWMPMECQSLALHWYSIGVGLIQLPEDWHRFRTVRVPPLNIFGESSRPIRGQDFELSTNQKPRFRPDSHCWTKLKSTNPREMCQLTADGMSLNCNWTVNRMPKDYQLMSIDCQWSVPRIPMECLLTANGLPIDDQWNANWPPFDWQ